MSIISKERLLLNSRLYLVLDKDSCPRGNVAFVIRKLGKGIIDLVQLRETRAHDRGFLKDAEIVRNLCHKKGIIFLVNNRLDIAKLVNADGLHLGQSDLPLKIAIKFLGKDKIIGISCHNLNQALRAQEEGANYISIGPIFSTKTKPELKPIGIKILNILKRKIKIPFFLIGGINQVNIKRVISFGAERVCVCRAICSAEEPWYAAIKLKKQFS